MAQNIVYQILKRILLLIFLLVIGYVFSSLILYITDFNDKVNFEIIRWINILFLLVFFAIVVIGIVRKIRRKSD